MNSLIVKLLTFLINLTKGFSGLVVIDNTTPGDAGNLYYEDIASGTLAYDNSSGTFTNGETITGGTSLATAVIVSKTATVFTLRAISGTFQNNEQVTGGTSGKTADANGTVTYFQYSVGETITGGTSNATGVITSITATRLGLDSISGTFQNAEILTGGTSAATSSADGTVLFNNTGTFYKIKADGAANAVIDEIEFADGTTIDTITLLKGDELNGNMVSVTITSGKVIAWSSPNVPVQ